MPKITSHGLLKRKRLGLAASVVKIDAGTPEPAGFGKLVINSEPPVDDDGEMSDVPVKKRSIKRETERRSTRVRAPPPPPQVYNSDFEVDDVVPAAGKKRASRKDASQRAARVKVQPTRPNVGRSRSSSLSCEGDEVGPRTRRALGSGGLLTRGLDFDAGVRRV